MTFKIDDKYYDVIIEYKNNKNLYIRVKDDIKIYVYAPKRMSEREIKKFIEANRSSLEKFIKGKENKHERLDDKYLYLGNIYDICYIEGRKIIYGSSKVFIGRSLNINNYYKKEAEKVFSEHYDICFNNFDEASFKPKLVIRRMTAKWGICNTKNKTITLNLDLIKLDTKYLDYVIYHELSHLKHPNHSSSFWNLVSKYVPNYKKIRKEMKDIL